MAIDIQAKLDELLEDNPEAGKYLTKLWYIPAGTQPPDDVTHVIRLASAESMERALTIGCVCKPEFALVLDSLLALVATQPH